MSKDQDETYEEILAHSKAMTPDQRQKRFSEFEDDDFSFTDPVESFIKNFDEAQVKSNKGPPT